PMITQSPVHRQRPDSIAFFALNLTETLKNFRPDQLLSLPFAAVGQHGINICQTLCAKYSFGAWTDCLQALLTKETEIPHSFGNHRILKILRILSTPNQSPLHQIRFS